MEKEIREKILKDYDKINNYLREILSSESPNFRVSGEDYITPTIIGPSLLMGDPDGKFIYLKNIRDCLERILIDGKAPFKPSHAPDYVLRFIE